MNTDEYVASHLNKTINEVVVHFTDTSEIKRPAHDYDKMPGMKKKFLFMPVREGVVLQRSFGCWCKACMHASAPGEGSMDSNYVYVECESGLPWKETSIERTDAAGVANRKQRTLNHARDLAQQLQCKLKQSNSPIWVAVENRGKCACHTQSDHDAFGTH